MKNIYRNAPPVFLVLVAIGVSVFVAYTVTTRTLNGVESVLWQIFVLVAGLTGSFIAGKQTAREAASEIIKPHARSAFRRLISLYNGLSRAANTIESSQSSKSDEDYQVLLARLEEIVTAQLTTADDALDDWNDLVPEDVAELKQKLRPSAQGGMDND